ncbi:lipopolysaccharide biosynthesis protein [Frigoribacterium sp. CFBP9030]|uniref:lipopolysaccharide biosynthesis protein n=1 Tax=Frigoribacterium sp. CFBP9030 TaxID=3096537 RepID=UPI002A6A0D11|nr:oligosaccharide flippase family protein [Frigoribacterium sp. CFBP9030]MDY0892245.1 oligosaccharide flippase family protein [Frigoribacterium sp. CFBP9030]
MRHVWKLALYIAIPSLSAAAPLIVIPAITSTHGATGWASVAVALAIGNAGAVLAELGWGVVGPQRVGREPDNRSRIYAESQASKGIAVAVLAPLSALAAYLVVGEDKGPAALLAFALVSAAISPSWYFIGTGRPSFVLMADTVPRVVLSIAAALVIAGGGSLWFYGASLLIAALVSYVLGNRLGHLPMVQRLVSTKDAVGIMRHQSVVILGRGVSTVYTALPAAFLGVVSPASVATFAAVDRPMRMGLNVLSALPTRLQSWLGHPDEALALSRSRKSILLNLGLGLFAGSVFFVAMPIVVPVLFSNTITVDSALALLGAVLVFLICASRGIGLSLVSAGSPNSITYAVIAAASVGLVGIFTLGSLWGTVGAFIALIVAETTGLMVQGAFLVRRWRKLTTK